MSFFEIWLSVCAGVAVFACCLGAWSAVRSYTPPRPRRTAIVLRTDIPLSDASALRLQEGVKRYLAGETPSIVLDRGVLVEFHEHGA